jgi:hypothetical protein
MASSNIRVRVEKEVADDIVRCAAEQNVVIVHMIGIFLIRQLERDSERKKRLMQSFLSRGGWLRTE